MLLAEAALIFATQLTDSTTNFSYDHTVMAEAVAAVVAETQDVSEIATAISIMRWESGAWRRDVASCQNRGDNGSALGLGQIHGFNNKEKWKACSKDYRQQVDVILFHIRDSVSICKRHGYSGHQLIGIYTHGKCFQGDETTISHWSDGRQLEKLLYTEQNETLSKHNVVILMSDMALAKNE